jgi:3-hydroxyacyl-CoA dehydrogenase/enoyl-CoA hydratase/3-hydroxybutyryl-CoA epimerase
MAAGLDAEARAFGELAATAASSNLIWLFMTTQKARRRAGSARHIGVVGAGFMGAAIAEVAAVAGISVRLKDVSADALAQGVARIGHMAARLQPRERQAAVGRVSGTTDYSGFAHADVVIEAVFEDLAAKRQVVADLERVLKAEAVIASNTSAIPIHQIAAQAEHPERVVGMHFFSPAERMPLLEVVRPEAASEEAVNTAVALGARMGKTAIVVADAPGFYTTRVLGVMLNEAALMLNEGARTDDVDRAMTDFGFPVGPFVLYDEIGLEVAQHVGETLAGAFGDRIPLATLVAELVAHGATGRKGGRGFLVWPHRAPNPLAYGGKPRREIAQAYIRDRLVLLFVNEAIRCLEEGVIASPVDGDLGAVLGLGFPPFRGGPFHYADTLGEGLCKDLEQLARMHGERYAPTETTRRGARFYEEQRDES